MRLSDVARVELGPSRPTGSVASTASRARRSRVYQAPGANAVDIAETVTARMEELAQRFPDDLKYLIVYDTTVFVKASIEEVVKTIGRSLRARRHRRLRLPRQAADDVIPLIAVPVSIVGTFAVLLLLGYSANTVSLLALVLSIGIVVDDAIVVIENVERVMEEEPHLSTKEATRKAMGEITAPILAITLVLLSVFVPVAFLPGISGELFRQFAVTVTTAMLISAVNALTLSPALCSVLLKPGPRPGGPIGWMLTGIDKMTHGYAWVVRRLVRVSIISLLLVAGAAALTYGVFRVTPQGFLPSEDQGGMFVILQVPEGASLNRTRQRIGQEVEEIMRADPAVEHVGPSSGSTSSAAASRRTAPSSSSSQGLRGAHDAGTRRGCGHRTGAVRSSRPCRTDIAVPLNVPPIVGLGSTGGFEYALQALQGQPPSDIAAVVRGTDDRGQSGPGAGRRLLHLRRQHAAALSRHRPRQGADAGRLDQRHLHCVAGHARAAFT